MEKNNKTSIASLSNIITCSRIFLAPVFLFVVLSINHLPFDTLTSVYLIWGIFILIEITDFFDGFVARLLKQESELGRILDPFADSLARLTYFLAFMLLGIMPVWIFVVVLYRDLWIGFVRLLLSRRGITQGARMSGKIKAWVYAIAGVFGILTISAQYILNNSEAYDILYFLTQIVFYVVVAAAIWTFFDYTVKLVKKV
ncbi:MAG: CDP-diacylglycerol--glycerol-3-phosphate 3-phosphatidyltransferase [Spirochaetales bacterium]|nr:CDP-diacylglycerol--glycerol-3-phosphate 3-phosphatidyltransferase [Spirochaetales bacterium]